MTKLAFGIGFVFLCGAPCVHAQIVSEIMYDLEGTDTSREWIEVYNSTGSSIDLTTFKLFEANTNHGITVAQGAATLESGSYAIIADNAAKFLTDWPGFGGGLFDSAFSLSNTGESLSIRTPDLVDTDTVSYDTAIGGAGDGKSLQRTSSGSFAALSPTPGAGTLSVPAQSGDTQTTQTTTEQSSTLTTGVSLVPIEPQLYAHAGKDRRVLVGADVVFSGKAFSKDGTVLEGAGIRYVWNFGDGMISQQQTVAHHFSYPGTYVVTLDVASGKYDAAARVVVTAVEPRLHIERREDGSVVITNGAQYEIDLSLWHVRRGDAFFTIPDHTVVLAQKEIILRPDAIRLPPGEVILLYPNGMPVGTGPMQAESTDRVSQALSLGSESVFPNGEGGSDVVEIQKQIPSEPIEAEIHAPSTTTKNNVASAAASGSGIWWFTALAGILLVGGGGIALLFRNKDPLDGWDIQEEEGHPDD